MEGVSLIGPGDIEFHFYELLKLDKDKFEKQINEISRALFESNIELELLPDKGICFEIAKKFKELGGKVIGTAPLSDKIFGIEHLKKYINAKTSNGKKVFNKIIDSGDWFKHDIIKGLMGNVLLYLGASPGTDGERNYAVYLYKLFKKFKQGVDVAAKKVHSEIRADDDFKIIIYRPFLINKKLADEDEAYIKKFGIKLVYVDNAEELKRELLGI